MIATAMTLFATSRWADKTKLASGHRISTDPAPQASVFFSYAELDNLVESSAQAAAFAKDHGYGTFAPSIPLLAEGPGLLPVKRFFSKTWNDSLSTASPEGLAFANNPANGYTFESIEGYCSSSPGPLGAGALKLIQWWSSVRKDSFFAPDTGSHAASAAEAGYTKNWTECYVHEGTGLWTKWPHEPRPNMPFPMSKDLLGWEYLSGVNPGYGGGDHTANSADTWYPTWGADGNLYSPWTDGSVHDDVTGQRIGSGSGGKPRAGYNSTTGQAVIKGNNPLNLSITEVKTFTSSTSPYQGRYPCGSLMYKGNWWYGTYYLDNPNATVDGNYVGPSPDPNCGNWCVQGPLVDFRLSTDKGATWHEPRLKASSPSDNLFHETAQNNNKVKFGAPHFVDFGQELEHSPDGKAYIVGHGASRPEAIQAWMLGDQIYMARVEPTTQAMADVTEWEFYAGGTGADAKWVRGDVSAAKPLAEWQNTMGVVTMTYMAAIKKYILSISTATHYPFMVKEFDTYFLESDDITGPWSMVNYMSKFGPEAYFVNHPSKFAAQQARLEPNGSYFDAFLMYSANFAFHSGSTPPNSGYHMNLQQSRFPLSKTYADKLRAQRGPESQQ